MTKLSILIPSHNRPTLFARCLDSVLTQLVDQIEVIVNNDSADIVAVNHPAVTYYYNKFDNLSEIYRFLFNKSLGEYVYFLEDDDYLTPSFVNTIFQNFGYDMIVGNYYPTYNPTFKFRCMTMFANDASFQINEELLQLSQHVFARSAIADFNFPKDCNIHNDQYLVEHVAHKPDVRIKTLGTVFYYQTSDGGDNISFPESSINGSI